MMIVKEKKERIENL